MTRLACFKSYDVRGRLGAELNEALAYRIGRGFARVLRPSLVVIGRDIRESSPALQAALRCQQRRVPPPAGRPTGGCLPTGHHRR